MKKLLAKQNEGAAGCENSQPAIDSCHSRCIGINKIYVLNSTAVAKLLQYSSSRVEHRDGFSLHK